MYPEDVHVVLFFFWLLKAIQLCSQAKKHFLCGRWISSKCNISWVELQLPAVYHRYPGSLCNMLHFVATNVSALKELGRTVACSN